MVIFVHELKHGAAGLFVILLTWNHLSIGSALRALIVIPVFILEGISLRISVVGNADEALRQPRLVLEHPRLA